MSGESKHVINEESGLTAMIKTYLIHSRKYKATPVRKKTFSVSDINVSPS